MKNCRTITMAMLLIAALLCGCPAHAEGIEVGIGIIDEAVPETDAGEVDISADLAVDIVFDATDLPVGEIDSLALQAGALAAGDVVMNADDDDDYADYVDADELEESRPEDFVIADGVLTRYTGSAERAIIPAGVTAIGDHAFDDCQWVTSVVIPDSVTSIGANAFRLCCNLLEVVIPDSVTSIGEGAFRLCGRMTNIVIGKGVTRIGNEAFDCCEELTSVVIPDSVTSIGEYAFTFCKNLKSVVIPDSVTTIDPSVFYFCESLTDVTIGRGISVISNQMFYRCSKLASVVIPDNITSIGNYAFFGCESLTGIVIPNSVTSVGANAFNDCTNLASAVIGNGVTAIDYHTFSGCARLTEVVIPDNVTRIGEEAFDGCASLSRAIIGKGVTCIEDRVFRGCVGLTDVVIPDSVTFLGAGAFDGCAGLAHVDIGKGVTGIMENTFRGCAGLTGIVIPDRVAYIEKGAFSACAALSDVTITKNIDIEDDAFEGCSAALTFHTPCETQVTKWARSKGYKVDPTAHTPVKDSAVPATYSKTGLTKGVHCSVCGTVLEAQQVIPKLKLPKGSLLLKKNTAKKAKAGAKLQIVLEGTQIKKCKSDNPAVAAVTNKGAVSAKLAGTAKITVTPKKGKALVLTLKVSDAKAPKKLAIVQGKKATLKLKKKLKLGVTLKPAGARYALTWKSSNTKIAAVNQKGVVTAKKKGKAKITAATQNGLKATIEITVQ